LSPGTYDGISLAAMIQTRLGIASANAGQSGTWTVTYYTFNIAMAIAFTNAFVLSTNGSQGFLNPAFTHPYSYNTPRTILTLSYVSVLPLDVIYLTSQRFANVDTFGPQGDHSTLMAAVINHAFGSILDASMPTGVWLDVPAMTTQMLDFQLRDRSYNILQNMPNISFTITLD
jgi:hypothetical protein